MRQGLGLLDEFREGNVPAQAGRLAFYQACKRFPALGQTDWVLSSGLGPLGRADLINELERDSVIWAITAEQDAAVKVAITSIPEGEWKEPVVGFCYEIAQARCTR